VDMAMWRTKLLLLSVWLFANAIVAGWPDASKAQTVSATLNGLEITLDSRTGSIVQLSHPGPGVILKTTADAATLLDLAYPAPQFEPLRLASRFSAGAKISKADGQVVVHWDKLHASRSFVKVPGQVSATVTLKAAADGKSVIMSCRVENHSDNALRQVLFPDLLGLLPFAGVEQTEFSTGSAVIKPFVQLAKPRGDEFYAINGTFREFKSSGKESNMTGRWLVLGGQRSGFSLFPARTVWDTEPTVFLQMWERIGKLRLMCNHYVSLGKGATWTSGDYWLTPYRQSRAEATGAYQIWLKRAGGAP
jgi:hypothetical protein